MRFFVFFSLIFILTVISSCGFSDRQEISTVTGWKLNSVETGGFFVPSRENSEQQTGPGLVFIQGGMFVMGDILWDIMGDWNQKPSVLQLPLFIWMKPR